MTKPDRLIAEAISIADGEIVGRVRLQKIFYLLEQLGLGVGLRFDYHYGPYSRDLDSAIDAAKAFHSVKEELRHRVPDGAPFSVFSVPDREALRPASCLGRIPVAEAERQIRRMKRETATVIELAATIHWLKHFEPVADWGSELRVRKGVKAQNGRTEAALGLLADLGLDSRDGMAA